MEKTISFKNWPVAQTCLWGKEKCIQGCLNWNVLLYGTSGPELCREKLDNSHFGLLSMFCIIHNLYLTPFVTLKALLNFQWTSLCTDDEEVLSYFLSVRRDFKFETWLCVSECGHISGCFLRLLTDVYSNYAAATLPLLLLSALTCPKLIIIDWPWHNSFTVNCSRPLTVHPVIT